MSTNNNINPYYFTQPPPNYNLNNWSYWTPHSQNIRSTQSNRSTPPTYSTGAAVGSSITPSVSTTVSTPSSEQRSQPYYSSTLQGLYPARSTGQYAVSSTGQYIVSPGQYGQYSSGQYINNTHTSSYRRNYYGKRKSESESDATRKSGKKKKKPLSQNIPLRKDWSVADARRALFVEKDYNKRHKSVSLIIKFPDIELSRDIVSKFHPAIDSVHFQQPSTPRFCFVTLNESADSEAVIKDLNKTPFGQGFLTAEIKKDREDEINIGPEDIDPLTLYVGNLAQEVTKEDMVTTYPNHKRVDIGYAKKMKYTRYAFVSFKCVNDSIEAFRKTHATQMFSKSLIVRFRRLNGTVGMPGEPKPQMPPRRSDPDYRNGSDMTSNNNHDNENQHCSDVDTESYGTSGIAPWENVDVSQWEVESYRSDRTKEEPPEDSDYEEDDRDDEIKPSKDYMSPFVAGSVEVAFSLHKPKIKEEIKKEKEDEDYSFPCSMGDESNDISSHSSNFDKNKQTTPVDFTETISDDLSKINSEEDTIDIPLPPDKIKEETIKTENENTYNSLRALNSKISNIPFAPVEVKRETCTPTLDEVSNDEVSNDDKEKEPTTGDTEEFVRVKSEPEDNDVDDDETNDGDEDDSSDESDDFNFSNILNSIDQSKKLKKFKKSVP